MSTYIALLRGINVGGHHKVPMADLRDAVEAFGAEDVSTYIQSGNVIFRSDVPAAELGAALTDLLTARFGFPIPVVIRTAAELAGVADTNPLAHLDVEEKFRHVVFLAEEPDNAAVAAFDVSVYAPDELVVRGRDIYLAYPNGSARSKLTADVIQRALGSTATARNWRTVRKLLELVRALDESRPSGD